MAAATNCWMSGLRALRATARGYGVSDSILSSAESLRWTWDASAETARPCMYAMAIVRSHFAKAAMASHTATFCGSGAGREPICSSSAGAIEFGASMDACGDEMMRKVW